MNGAIPLQKPAPAVLLRPDRCELCKHRAVGADNIPRCHQGPPQRVALMLPSPQGLQIKVLVDFPEVVDTFWCAQFKKGLA